MKTGNIANKFMVNAWPLDSFVCHVLQEPKKWHIIYGYRQWCDVNVILRIYLVKIVNGDIIFISVMSWQWNKMQFYKERILNAAQLKRLSEHKYSCTSASLLDAWLQPWWCWLVSKTPLWLAPNLITILGLIVNIFTTLILVW